MNGQRSDTDLGKIGFKRIELREDDDDFAVDCNGHPVFCRGACWTIDDIVAMRATASTLRQSLQLAKRAGMNMVRVGGTMVYEQDEFYQICDELGIMVWQDFMFANMDYPVDDQAFRSSVESEARQQLQRLVKHACLTVMCGNSEVEQQAAMLGMPREYWRNDLFSEIIPDLCRQWAPDLPYVPSTPSGGAMPFHVGTGVTHYYGVGAYQRPAAQVRGDNVRFTAECLGFSNVPEADVVNAIFHGESPATHHPDWKSGVPRDSGAGWDFEDVRDHYLEELFGVDPVATRSADAQQYLALGRVTSGEMMSQVFSEWRSPASRCAGALVWFFRDLAPGAGWGILDSGGRPKACYYYLRRVLQPRQIVLTNEGLDGFHVHVINESDTPLNAALEINLVRDGHVTTARARTEINVPARSTVSHQSDALLDAFHDVTYAYRFGPPKHDLVTATLVDEHDAELSTAYLFPHSQLPVVADSGGIRASSSEVDDNTVRIDIDSRDFLYAACLDLKGFMPEDNYFHVQPGRRKSVLCHRSADTAGPLKGYVEALNVSDPVRIDAVEPE